VLALVCSAVNEAISTARRWRAQFLREGIANLLDPDDPAVGAEHAKVLYAHPVVNGLIRPNTPRGKRRPPSYLPARVFATALLDFDRKGAERSVKESIDAVPSPQTRAALQALWADSNGRQDVFRHAVEVWYDDAMERVSGWYRRRMHLLMWVIAGVIVLALNVDTIRIADHLWKDRQSALLSSHEPSIRRGRSDRRSGRRGQRRRAAAAGRSAGGSRKRPSGGSGWGMTVLLKAISLL
jgi:hypothetical protein